MARHGEKYLAHSALAEWPEQDVRPKLSRKARWQAGAFYPSCFRQACFRLNARVDVVVVMAVAGANTVGHGYGHDVLSFLRPLLAQHRDAIAEHLFETRQQFVRRLDLEILAQVEDGFASLRDFQAQARAAGAGKLAQQVLK